MQHQLFEADKTTTLTCNAETLITETNTGGKSKTSSKTFADQAEAVKQFFKKEWDLLKKGAVMKTQTPAQGHPLLHLFIGTGYTGCLSFTTTPQGIYVYKPGGSGREMGTQDELLRITADGTIAEVLTLPSILPWEICYDAQHNHLLIDLDHYIYQYDFGTASFTALTNHLQQPASFVCVAGNTRAYATHPAYYISHSPHSQRTEMPLEVSVIRGSIPFCASLSPNGQLLALHHQEGEIKLINTISNSTVNTLRGSFERAEQLIWTRDGNQLIVHERYGQSQLSFFEVATGQERVYESLALPTYSQDITDCCINADNTLLVCVQRTTAFVFDFTTKTFLYQFPLHHCIKTAQVRFVDDKVLGVRTDYGCFSLYQL